MDASDTKYILALMRRELLLQESREIMDSLSHTISKLSSLRLWTKMLETDLQIPESDSYNSLQEQAVDSLCRGREHIAKSLQAFYELPMSSEYALSGTSQRSTNP
jgi:hypothetical protein